METVGGSSRSFDVEAASMRSSTSIQHWTSLPSKYQSESRSPRSVWTTSRASSGDGDGGRDRSRFPGREDWSRMRSKYSTLLAITRMSYFKPRCPSLDDCKSTSFASTRKITDA